MLVQSLFEEHLIDERAQLYPVTGTHIPELIVEATALFSVFLPSTHLATVNGPGTRSSAHNLVIYLLGLVV